ncbi:MAG: PAS domain S-box protein [Methanomicrobiaceae archaeon]|nr:PAS domain S-box protein [Methanomicrobiaceae archaeon]
MDKEELLLSVAKTFLERAGDITVETARSVEEAMRKLASLEFDAIVADYEIPPQSGLAFLRAVRRKGLDTPFLIFTNRGDEGAMIKAITCGADEYLQKGGNPMAEFAELAHRIRSVVAQKTILKNLHDARETMESIRGLMQTVRIPLVVLDESLRVIDANPPLYTTFHLTPEGMVGLPLSRAGNEEWNIPDLHAALAAVLCENHAIENLEIEHAFTAAGRKTMLLNARELVRPAGGSRMILLSIEDITAIRQKEREIRESERRMTDIINFLPDATFAIDEQRRVIAWNEAMETLTGMTAQTMMGQGNYEYALPFYQSRRPILIDMVTEPDEVIRHFYPTAAREGHGITAETVMTRPGRTQSVLWAKATPLYTDCGAPAGAVESIRDITAWREAEDALRGSEQRFRELADLLPVTLFEADADCMFTFVNQNAYETFGYTQEDLQCGVPVAQAVVPEERARAQHNIEACFSGRTNRGNEYTAVRKDGTTFPVTIYSAPIVHGDTVVGFRGVVVDITEQKQAREALRRSEQRMADIINFLPDATFAIDREGVVLAWNRAMEELTGIRAAEMVGTGGYAYAHPFYKRRRPILIDLVFQPDEVIERYYADVRREGQALMAETCTRLPDGTDAYLWGKATPLYDEEGEFVGSIESIRNITELRETEKVLKESEDRYRAIFENSGTAMAIIEEDGTISLANAESENLFGYPRKEAEHLMKWDAFIPDHERARLRAYVTGRDAESASFPRQFESEVVDRRGTIKHGLFTVDRIPGTRRLIISVMDITARKRDREKINHLNRVMGAIRDVTRTITRESNRSRMIQGICDTLIDARGYVGACIALVDQDRTVTDAATAGVIEALLPFLAMEGDAMLPENLNRVLDSRGVFLRTVETQPFAAPAPGSPGQEWKAMSTRLEHQGHLYGLLKVVVPREIPLDEEETAIFTELAEDIAYALYNADLEEEHHYHDALKMANNKLNLLSGITRHDILNQTTGMAGLLALLQERLPEDTAAQEFMGHLKRSVETIRRQISFTRDYENLGMVAPEWFAVESLVQVAAATANLGEVRLGVTTGPVEVFADPMLEMVFVNLIDNALRHGGSLTAIRVSCEPQDRGCRIVIEDDGAGVLPEMKDVIFEKGVGTNTGYGLFLVREILGITGMSIQETGTHGEGARFEILVPAGRWRMHRSKREGA